MPQNLDSDMNSEELAQLLRSKILDLRMARMRLLKLRQNASASLYDFPDEGKSKKALRARFSEFLTQIYNAEVFLKEAIRSMDAVVALSCDRLIKSREAVIKELALEVIKSAHVQNTQKIEEEDESRDLCC
jgi:hypothetical protein